MQVGSGRPVTRRVRYESKFFDLNLIESDLDRNKKK
jgi:hypothetical protein